MIITMITAKLCALILRLTGRGATTLPGRVALKMKYNILTRLSKGVRIICVTGTNGKTTTCSLLEHAFKSSGISYFINKSGANMLSGALPFYTKGDSKRHIGNIVFETPFGTAVGFENHSGKTYLNGLPPLGRVIKGFGNNGEDKGEGLHIKNTFCTYAHGPFLPKNPAVCDELLCRAAKETLKPIDDSLEIRCNRQLINRFK